MVLVCIFLQGASVIADPGLFHVPWLTLRVLEGLFLEVVRDLINNRRAAMGITIICNRTFTIATTTIASVLASAVVYADPGDGRYYDYHGMMSWGGWIFGPFMMLIYLALIVGAIVFILRLLGHGDTRLGGRSADRAMIILRERFAKGELTQEEYEAARKTLE